MSLWCRWPKPTGLLFLTSNLSCLMRVLSPFRRGLLPIRRGMRGGAGEPQFLLTEAKTLPGWSGQQLWQLGSAEPGEKPSQFREANSQPRGGSYRRGGGHVDSVLLPSVLQREGSDPLHGSVFIQSHPERLLSGRELWQRHQPPVSERVVCCSFCLPHCLPNRCRRSLHTHRRR